jgi:hypothetical protein
MRDGIRHGVEQMPVYGRWSRKVKDPGYAAHAKHSLYAARPPETRLPRSSSPAAVIQGFCRYSE